MYESRREYLIHHRSARAWAALDRATNDQMKVTYDPYVTERDSLNGKHVVIIGSGVGGLTTAYELLTNNSDVKVTILEARDRTGGRCLTLRTGDTLTEDKNSDLYSSPGDTQVVRFERPVGDSEPYLNAGPGRIPSSHKLLLDYLRRFGVAVEIYVMASESNLKIRVLLGNDIRQARTRRFTRVCGGEDRGHPAGFVGAKRAAAL